MKFIPLTRILPDGGFTFISLNRDMIKMLSPIGESADLAHTEIQLVGPNEPIFVKETISIINDLAEDIVKTEIVDFKQGLGVYL